MQPMQTKAELGSQERPFQDVQFDPTQGVRVIELSYVGGTSQTEVGSSSASPPQPTHGAPGKDSSAPISPLSPLSKYLKRKADEAELAKMVYVVVVDLDGTSHPFTIDPTVTTGEMLLDMMHQPHKTPEGMRLIFAGKQFASNEPLSTYNVVDGATIHMTGRLRGAGVFSTVSRDTSIGCMRKGAFVGGDERSFDAPVRTGSPPRRQGGVAVDAQAGPSDTEGVRRADRAAGGQAQEGVRREGQGCVQQRQQVSG